MVSALLVVAIGLLGVVITLLLVATLRKTPSADVERWHRTLNGLRDAAPGSSSGVEQFVDDATEPNVRLLPAGEEHAEQRPEPHQPAERREEPHEEQAEECPAQEPEGPPSRTPGQS